MSNYFKSLHSGIRDTLLWDKLRKFGFLREVWRFIRVRLLNQHPPRLYEVNLLSDRQVLVKGRALLAYLVHPLIDTNQKHKHTNIWMTREIVRILNELGFVVDVVNYKDSTFHVKYKYDLFIGHGGINFGAISSQLPVETVRVFFSSMCYWRFNNKEEIARFSELEKRRNIKLPLDRYIEAGEDDALQVADGVIAIGNNFTKKTYQQYASKIYMVNNTTPEDNHYDLSKKDFSVGRDHFLFYAGGGNVHKGLDLLFEAFMDCRDQHLWVCTRIDDVLMEAYAEDLQNHPNIHLVGWVEARSKQFYDLVDLCNWVICPSCSEASCGSIVECLNYGLIPLISDATSIDVGDFGVRINPCNIQEIVRTISRVSTFSPERCQRMSDKARATALQDYSEEKFHRDFKNSLSQILQKCEVLLP